MEAVANRMTALLVPLAALAGCVTFTPEQDAGWTAFHGCHSAAPSAVLEDLFVGGRVGYVTREGVDFSAMKACMEQRGYACDISTEIGSLPVTHCYPRTRG
jgi:hypothetical protein